jgi:hypothetical protein
MREAFRGAAVCAMAVLTQACAGGMMESAPSAPVGGTTQSAPSYGIYGVDSYFKLEWQPDERRGQPMVSGYVTNQWGLAMRNVRLRVEALDAAGVTTATYIGYVNGILTPGAHVYFEVPVQAKAPAYRVTVLSFDPVQGLG